MKKLILAAILITVASMAYAATAWTGAGYWYKETTAKGAVRFSKITELQLKNMCTITPPVPVIPPVIPPIPPVSFMPFVDISKNMVPAVGFSELRLLPTTEKPSSPADGAFRIGCAVSHMSNDDPITQSTWGSAPSYIFWQYLD